MENAIRKVNRRSAGSEHDDDGEETGDDGLIYRQTEQQTHF